MSIVEGRIVDFVLLRFSKLNLLIRHSKFQRFAISNFADITYEFTSNCQDPITRAESMFAILVQRRNPGPPLLQAYATVIANQSTKQFALLPD